MSKLYNPFFSCVGTKSFMNSLILIITNPASIEQIKTKILHLIQHWGILFEDDPNNPLFNQVYTALKARMDEFPNEDEARAKLNKSKSKTIKKANAYKPQSSQPKPFSSPPVYEAPAQDRSYDQSHKKPKPIQRKSKNIILSDAHQTLK